MENANGKCLISIFQYRSTILVIIIYQHHTVDRLTGNFLIQNYALHMKRKLAFKLFNKRKDGTYGPLFINRKQRLNSGVWYDAEDHPTKGYAHRPGWHCCHLAYAPHLSYKNRVWCIVEIDRYTEHLRPAKQGGLWYTADRLRIKGELPDVC